jgi:hypothetical protein
MEADIVLLERAKFADRTFVMQLPIYIKEKCTIHICGLLMGIMIL